MSARVSQTGLLVVRSANPKARVSQEGLLVVGTANPKARVSQEGLLVVGTANPKARVSQTGLLIVVPNIPSGLVMQLAQGAAGTMPTGAVGEPLWASDTHKLFVGGSDAANHLIGPTPAMVAAGGSHAAGVVPDPGAVVHNQQWVLTDAGVWAPAKGQVVAASSVFTDESTSTVATWVNLATLDQVSVTLDQASTLLVLFSSAAYNPVAGSTQASVVFLDGVGLTVQGNVTLVASNAQLPNMLCGVVSVGVGTHTITIKHWTDAGTAHWLVRSLTVWLVG